MQSCVGPSTSSQQAAQDRRESSLSQSQPAAAAKHQTDLTQWQSTGAKCSQTQTSAGRNSQPSQQAADAKRKLPEWMSATSSGKTATKKKLKNSSLFS